MVANQLLMAAVKIWESDPDSPYVLGLTLNALAFISDAVGHAVLRWMGREMGFNVRLSANLHLLDLR